MLMVSHTEPPAVLVTGAGGGIGAATTRTLAEHGYRVYAGVHRCPHDPAESAGVEVIELDVTSTESVRAAARQVARRQGAAGLRAVVNNAGVIVQGPMELVPADELHRQFAVNVFGPAEVTRAFLPLLRSGRGRVVNISAPTGRLAVPYAGPISSSKAALESLSAATRVELAPWGIPVVIVVPGSTDTAIFAKADAAATTALADTDPELVGLYRRRLDAVANSMSSMKPAPAQTVADTILRAVQARRPKSRYLAGSDARLFAVLSHLPARLRDGLLSRGLGLNKIGPDR
jgi:NAD(P)-dependent dehydrogenase (short-subunit alcohol dehydrogenase family)